MKLTKFERWSQENLVTASGIGALHDINNQRDKGIAYNKMLDLLMKIRYCNWPTIGLGIGLRAEEMDEVIMEAERRNYASPKPHATKTNSMLNHYTSLPEK